MHINSTVTESHYNRAKATGGMVDWEAFRIQNKNVKHLIANAKEEYIKEQLEQNENNPRKFWRNIQDISGLGKSKNMNKLGKMMDEFGNEYENQGAVDFFNHYYTNAGPRLAEHFQDIWDAESSDINVESTFDICNITEPRVRRLIKDIKLSKSCSIEGISARLLRDAFEVLVPELTYLFNTCLEIGDIPRSWCHGTISPLPKTKTGSKQAKDWRPITQIPLSGKLLEKLVHEQVYEYFDRNNILCKMQYGFHPGMSTSHAIFDVLKTLYANWNQKLYTGCIFVDFAHAFETIDHNILISKLRLYGMGRIPLNFFRNYITNRTQSTRISSYNSGLKTVTYGTAQGSVLGPLIFIIYVNDILMKVVQNNSIYMYADDMLIVSQDESMDKMCDDIQGKLDYVMKWCRYNKLTINRDKTKFMLVSLKHVENVPKVTINGTALSSVTNYEYLGMTLDNKLNMFQRIDSMYKKASMKLGILCKIRRFITDRTAARIYKTMIRPHLEYIDFVIESGTKECIAKIDKLQNCALRRIEYCNNPADRLEYGDLRTKYNIEKLDVRRKRSLLRIMYNHSTKDENVDIITHNINLRSRNKVKLKNKFSSLTKLHVSPYYRGCVLWDQLPENIQTAENITAFKSQVKMHIR